MFTVSKVWTTLASMALCSRLHLISLCDRRFRQSGFHLTISLPTPGDHFTFALISVFSAVSGWTCQQQPPFSCHSAASGQVIDRKVGLHLSWESSVAQARLEFSVQLMMALNPAFLLES